MALTPPKTLVEGVTINSSNQTLYTVPANVNLLVTHASIHNTTGTARTVTIWVGASATDAKQRFKRTIAGYDTLDVDGLLGQVITEAILIIGVCDLTSVVSFTMSGTEFPAV